MDMKKPSATREELKIGVGKIRRDIADLESMIQVPEAAWMQKQRLERIAFLKSVAAKIEAQIGSLPPENSD